MSVYHHLAKYTLKISDMGLSKQLDGENSFSTLSLPTSRHHQGGEQKVFEPVGTIGWQAPEMITSYQETISKNNDDQLIVDGVSRKTMAVDVFSLGCVFYFILSMGSHPFGEWFEREANIVNNGLSLEKLEHMPDAYSLIEKMLDVNPIKRPSSSELCNHHFFWTASKRLDYLTTLSDKLEQMKSDSSIILMLQSKAGDIFGIRWDRNIDETLLEDSGKYRKYDPYAVADLLRLIRNKRNHYHELGAATKAMFGSFPDGFCHYFEAKFPTLLGICIEIETTITLGGDSPKNNTSVIDNIRETNPDLEASEAVMTSEGLVSPIIGSCVVWQDSALCNTFRCRGWWRDASEWTDMLTYSSSSKTSKKTRSVHHARALSDAKYRTKLCSHWEMSNGESCPMRKKGKCVFAHGLLELRLREIRVDSSRGNNNLGWNSPKN
jgi:serine/threonine protein kinase